MEPGADPEVLVIATISRRDAPRVRQALDGAFFAHVQIDARSGLLDASDVLLLIPIRSEQLPALKSLLAESAAQRIGQPGPVFAQPGGHGLLQPGRQRLGGMSAIVTELLRFERLGGD